MVTRFDRAYTVVAIRSCSRKQIVGGNDIAFMVTSPTASSHQSTKEKEVTAHGCQTVLVNSEFDEKIAAKGTGSLSMIPGYRG